MAMLKHGANPNETDYEGNSMLWHATRGEHPDADCKSLLEGHGGKFIPPVPF